LTVISIASVVAVYAALINTFNGGEVTIGGGASGQVTYSTDNSTWTGTLSVGSETDDWYSKLTIDGGQYSGSAVEIIWQLQKKTSDTTWEDVSGATVTTSMTLTSGSQDVYATTSGLADSNRDWGGDVTENGTYRVVATANTAPA
jgi:hypothetical protein